MSGAMTYAPENNGIKMCSNTSIKTANAPIRPKNTAMSYQKVSPPGSVSIPGEYHHVR